MSGGDQNAVLVDVDVLTGRKGDIGKTHDQITFANPYLAQMLGLAQPDEVIGDTLPDSFWDDPHDKHTLLSYRRRSSSKLDNS